MLVVHGGESRKLGVRIEGVGEFLVPTPDHMPVRWARRLRALADERGDDDGLTEFVFEFFGEYLGEAMDDLTLEELTTIARAWRDSDGSGLLGESPASSPS